MEIIKIFLGIFLFFYLSWLQIFYSFVGIIVYFYYKYNPILSLQGNFENNFIYSLIYFIDFLFNFINYLWVLIKKTKYINYLPLKLEQLNNKYLQYKMRFGFYLMLKLTNLFFSFYKKEEPKKEEPKNIQQVKKNILKIKLDTNEEIASFLEKIESDLKNKAS
jgi:hypothetical protein